MSRITLDRETFMQLNGEDIIEYYEENLFPFYSYFEKSIYEFSEESIEHENEILSRETMLVMKEYFPFEVVLNKMVEFISIAFSDLSQAEIRQVVREQITTLSNAVMNLYSYTNRMTHAQLPQLFNNIVLSTEF